MTAGHLGRSVLRPYKDKFKPVKFKPDAGAWGNRRLTICGSVEGDVDYGFEFDGGPLFGRGAELPLA